METAGKLLFNETACRPGAPQRSTAEACMETTEDRFNSDGQKQYFRKVTITLPPEAYELLISECARRKIAGEKNHLVSALIREALASYLPNFGASSAA
jgi:hypothetical protein